MALWLLERLPPLLRRCAVEAGLSMLARNKLRPHFRRHLVGDAVVIGGGNLFSDHDLNFPIKLSEALQLVGERLLPVTIFGAGVATELSPRGRALFLNGLRQVQLRQVWLRDLSSIANWRRHFGELGIEPRLCRDPAILASARFPASRSSSSREVGVGITSPAALRYHSGTPLSDDTMIAWYARLVEALRAEGHPVMVFDNGSPEDRAFVGRFRAAMPSAPDVRFAAPDSPADLCALVSGLRGCVAHRLHANIIAYAYDVPQVGLRWDSKLDAFLATVERERWLADAPAADPKRVADLLGQAMAEGIDPHMRERVLTGAQNDIDELVLTLTSPRSSG